MATLSTCSYKFPANWEKVFFVFFVFVFFVFVFFVFVFVFFFVMLRAYLLLKPLSSNAFSAWISMLH